MSVVAAGTLFYLFLLPNNVLSQIYLKLFYLLCEHCHFAIAHIEVPSFHRFTVIIFLVYILAQLDFEVLYSYIKAI